MKRIYKKPTLTVESFVTEEVMGDVNVLSEANENIDEFGMWKNNDPNNLIFGHDQGTGNILNSIDYSTFQQN